MAHAPSELSTLLKDVYNFVWPSEVVSSESLGRIHRVWLQQQFSFPRQRTCRNPAAAPLPPWGLVQLENGACGVLAAVQAWLIRRLLAAEAGGGTHGTSEAGEAPSGASADLSWMQHLAPEVLRVELAEALADMLWHIAHVRTEYSRERSRVGKEGVVPQRVMLVLPSSCVDSLPAHLQALQVTSDPDPPLDSLPAATANPAPPPAPVTATSAVADAPSPPPISAAEWACPRCTALNKAEWVMCNACLACHPDAPEGSSSTPEPAAAPAPGPAPDTAGGLGTMTPWTCSVCTLYNEAGTTVCGACGSSRPEAEGSSTDSDAALAAAMAGGAPSTGLDAQSAAVRDALQHIHPPPGRVVADPYWSPDTGLFPALRLLHVTDRAVLAEVLAAVVDIFETPNTIGAATAADADADVSAGYRASVEATYGSTAAEALLQAASPAEVDAAVKSASACSHSGLSLLVYSAVLTRGLANCRHDTSRDSMFMSLIFADATSEQALLNLLLAGVARNDVNDATWCDVRLDVPIGFLTAAEGYAVCDMWKRPLAPVWVTHGGNHYTTVWSRQHEVCTVSDTPVQAQREAAASAQAESAATEGKEQGQAPPAAAAGGGAGPAAKLQDPAPVHVLHLFNGLHPPRAGGAATRHACFRAAMWGRWGEEEGSPNPEQEAARAAAKEAAEARKVKKIISSRVLPGGDKETGPWEFLVVCKKSGSLENPAATAPPYGGKWYCRDCMLPKVPNWAGYNEEGAPACKGCGKLVSECGFAHWLSAEELPVGKRRDWERGHAPQLLQVLRVRWPALAADWSMAGSVAPSMFG